MESRHDFVRVIKGDSIGKVRNVISRRRNRLNHDHKNHAKNIEDYSGWLVDYSCCGKDAT